MECPHCGVEGLMGASKCVSCGESMFSRPGARGRTLRPASSPAPWQESDSSDSGLLEPRRIQVDSDTGSGSYTRPASTPPARTDSGRFADDDDGISFESLGPTDSGRHAASPTDSGRFVAPPPLGSSDSGRFAPLEPTPGATPESTFGGRPDSASKFAELPSVPEQSGESDEDGVPPAMPAPIDRSRREAHSLCNICFGPVRSPLVETCRECEERASGVYSESSGPVRVTTYQAPRKGSVARRAATFVVVAVGLVAAGMGVVDYVDRPTAGAQLLAGTQSESVEVGFAVPDMGATDFDTEYDVRIHRAGRKTQLATSLSSVFDVQQLSEYAARVALLENRPGTATLNVRSQASLTRQDGDYKTDAGIRDVYPWKEHVSVQRMLAPERGRVAREDGSAPVPLRDLPPFVLFGTTGAPDGALDVGETWSADVALPCLADLDGRFVPHGFAARFEYAGRRIVDARECAIVEVEARPDTDLGKRFARLDLASGTVAGALAFDVSTGLLVRADLKVDTETLRGTAADPDERVTVVGKLVISRTGR